MKSLSNGKHTICKPMNPTNKKQKPSGKVRLSSIDASLKFCSHNLKKEDPMEKKENQCPGNAHTPTATKNKFNKSKWQPS